MYKSIQAHSFGDPSAVLITGGLTKVAAYTPPEMEEAIRTLEKKAGKTYLLVNALGDSETWGSNVNGDAFPREALLNKTASHGYKTFEMYAHAYRHHQNKDPEKAMGRVKAAAWNPMMRRVELLLELDNTKAKNVIEKVANGEYSDWSMGCRVPYDICSKCGNRAKTAAAYCEHLKFAMNEIDDETGKRICAINTLPKFFDISEVVVGADKTAKTLMKVASQGRVLLSAVLGEQIYGEEKDADHKQATMDKEVPVEAPTEVKPQAQSGGHEGVVAPRLSAAVGALQTYEPNVNRRVIKKLAAHSLGESLSTLSYSGILLRPAEFQDLVLVNDGKEKLADELAQRGITFIPLADSDIKCAFSLDKDLISVENVKEAALADFVEYVPHRSIFEKHALGRLERMGVLPASRLTKTAAPANYGWVKSASTGLLELLGTLGLSYFLYRKGFPTEAREFEVLLAKKPWMGPVILGGVAAGVNVLDAIAGPSPAISAATAVSQAHAKVGGALKTIGSVVGPIGLAYLASASARRKEQQGNELNPVEKILRDYPALVGPLGVYGLSKLRQKAKL